MQRCNGLLRESLAPELLDASHAAGGIEALIVHIQRIDWRAYLAPAQEEDVPAESNRPRSPAPSDKLEPLLGTLLRRTMEIHEFIADSFLNHQARIAAVSQPMLRGF